MSERLWNVGRFRQKKTRSKTGLSKDYSKSGWYNCFFVSLFQIIHMHGWLDPSEVGASQLRLGDGWYYILLSRRLDEFPQLDPPIVYDDKTR